MIRFDAASEAVIGAAIAVHRELGPGLLESAYSACLQYELLHRGIRFEAEKPIPVRYKDVQIDCAYRLDLLVEDSVVVELKSVDRLERLHDAQLLSYLRLTECHVGLLINFNVVLLKQGIRRLVNAYEPESVSSRSS